MIRHALASVITSAMALLVMAIAVATPHAQSASSTASEPKPTVINLNTATAAEFEKLPGVGPAMAARIVEYRQKNGAFKKLEELMNVKGIGEKVFLKLKPLVTVAPPKSAER